MQIEANVSRWHETGRAVAVAGCLLLADEQT
jgi:hypothetical protein